MSIKRLPHDISSRIAAGEVIDRPASAIKELLENSLDAGSCRIAIYLEQGGKSSFCIEDDGCGIPFEQLPLAVERYATSKIDSIDDLERIRTLGYRGEALASIATVSRLELRARADGEEGGVIRLEGGVTTLHASVPAVKGTRIQVDDLFFNLPARRKFLKSASAELRHVTAIVRDYALMHPEKKFQVYSDGKLILDLGELESVEAVLTRIWGETSLYSGEAQSDSVRLRAWWSSLPGSRKTSVTTFVNGRRVQDATVRAAINATEGSVFGDWLVLIELPPEDVDVNIHPTKQEVRFRNSGPIFQLAHRVAKELLLKKSGLLTPQENSSHATHLDPWERSPLSVPTSTGTLPSPAPFSRVASPASGALQQAKAALWEVVEPEVPLFPDAVPSDPIQRALLGQTPKGYLIFSDSEGFALMDPHAAHERILFEEIARCFQDAIPLQRLTFPQEIPVAIASDALDRVEVLRKMGFNVQRGERSAQLTAVPAIRGLAHLSPVELLRSALRGIEQESDPKKRDREVWWRWARTACRDAVKLGGHFTPQSAQSLFQQLELCEQPYSCPHGRPTVIKISDKQLFEWFERG